MDMNELHDKYKEPLKSLRLEAASRSILLPELLFHYTSAESCFSIIETEMASKHPITLWASCALGMNDATEIRYGMELVHGVARDFVPEEELNRSFAQHYRDCGYAALESLETTCVACFCAAPDLLSQWRAYGRHGGGYALGFRRDILGEEALSQGFDLIPIIYNRADQLERVRSVFEQAKAIFEADRPEPSRAFWRMVIRECIHLALGFKHPSFAEEHEWRLLSTVQSGLHFRAGRWGVVPYKVLRFKRACLAQIWQGPTLDYDLTRRTLAMYLNRVLGIDGKWGAVEVRQSEIPLRNL